MRRISRPFCQVTDRLIWSQTRPSPISFTLIGGYSAPAGGVARAGSNSEGFISSTFAIASSAGGNGSTLPRTYLEILSRPRRLCLSSGAVRRASSDWVQPLSFRAACNRRANSIRIASGGAADDIVPLGGGVWRCFAMLSLSSTGRDLLLQSLVIRLF